MPHQTPKKIKKKPMNDKNVSWNLQKDHAIPQNFKESPPVFKIDKD